MRHPHGYSKRERLWRCGVQRVLLALIGTLGCSNATVGLAADDASPATLPVARQRALVDQYCVDCHDQQQQTAGLSLDELDLTKISEGAESWEKVVRKLRTGAMPPPEADQPTQAERDALATALEVALDRSAAANPNPGRSAVHRLNRTEYANAIRDLLALEVDSRALLPADDSGYGFDNNADTLSFSPVLLERYMSAAAKISRLAVGDPSIQPSIETYNVSKVLVQDERMSEELPFGSRGGVAIRHRFPLDGEYVLKLTLSGRPSRELQQLEARLDGKRIELFELDGTSAKSQYGGPASGDLEVRFTAKAGTRMVGVAFLKRTLAAEGLGPERLPPGNILFASGGANRHVSKLQIGGPYNAQGPGDTESRRRIFRCKTKSDEDDNCAEQIVARLARQAWRRPVTDEDVQSLFAFYAAGRKRGTFDAGIQAVLERLLVDPEFLFRVENDPPGIAPSTAYQLSDVELASRLSFFLWSSIPDDELLDVAERGGLRDPEALQTQIQRMLADERSDALITNFASQWLYLRNMRAVTPDINLYPEFDDNLREAFQRETELFLASQIRDDRSLLDLLSADYSFANERLARHYKIPNVYGSRYRRVSFPDGRRGGLIGQGSILTVTSYANRTSPVLRGKWLLENILGSPPPPPPPDVPELPDAGDVGTAATIRERLQRHSTDPSCASCHVRMDPLGFALENFDAIGAWRTIDESGAEIDATGNLPDGSNFEGPADLRELLLSRGDEFAWTVTSKLLTYALGRGLEYYDAPAIRKIMREAAADDHRWSSVILGIVGSQPFQMRRSKP